MKPFMAYTSMHQYGSRAVLSLDHWVASLGGDTTHVVIVTSHHDVALHSPFGTPAVCMCVCVCVCVGECGEIY